MLQKGYAFKTLLITLFIVLKCYHAEIQNLIIIKKKNCKHSVKSSLRYSVNEMDVCCYLLLV